ncbi:hypothetical protein Tco_0323816 [Tanacetum coccineum]
MMSMNITSPSSSLEQTNFVLEDWGTNSSDSSIEFSLHTCYVAIEANGSGCGCRLEFVSPGLSSSCSTSGSLTWDSLGCLGTVVEGTVRDRTVGLELVRLKESIRRDLLTSGYQSLCPNIDLEETVSRRSFTHKDRYGLLMSSSDSREPKFKGLWFTWRIVEQESNDVCDKKSDNSDESLERNTYHKTEVRGMSIRLHQPDGVRSKRYHVVPYGELNGIPIALVAKFGLMTEDINADWETRYAKEGNKINIIDGVMICFKEKI